MNNVAPPRQLRELHLFAGAGGGILGGMLLGHRTVCAVEINEYRRKILLSRQRDGILPRFPIWDDVRTFDGRAWRGKVDLLCGGFPCQAYSNAASGRNIAGKDLLHEYIRVTSEIQPAHVFAENVSRQAAEKACEYFWDLGYNPRFGEVSASDCGADHDRSRWWVSAYSHLHGELRGQINAEVALLPKLRCGVWESFPGEFRVADGMANRMDRIRAAGDGQVPAVAALAYTILNTPPQK